MWLPAVVTGVLLVAGTMRLTRTMLLDVLHQDYVRTARAKGLASSRVVIQHALPNALIPVITHSGLQIAFLLGGSAIIEQIFSLPGMGRLLVTSIGLRDYPIVQGIILVSGIVVVTINLTCDILAITLDHRIQLT
jgi:peptide/nickel transport system permease protein